MKKITQYLFIALLFSGNVYSSKNITLEEIFLDGIFNPKTDKSIIGSYHDENYYCELIDYSKIYKTDFETGKNKLLIFDKDSFEIFKNKYLYDYFLSLDNSKILLLTDIEYIYRHSYLANYYIFDIAKNELYPLSINGKQQLAAFSPNSAFVAFVRDNNLFITNLNTREEKQITFDGVINNIINGKPDWVYEEEFSFSEGFFWSPNSDKIAFYKFNESHVKQFNMTYYENTYPSWYQYKYPKAGEENSIVTVHIYHLNNENTVNADIGNETDQYIPRVEWTKNNDQLCITRLNRLQNQVDIIISDASTGNSKTIYTEKNKSYISQISDDHVTFIDDDEFLLFSEKSGYAHLYLYNAEGKEIRQLTKGNWDVESFSDYNPHTKTIYYRSYEESPLNIYVYSISKDGKNKQKITNDPGLNTVFFNYAFTYYLVANTSSINPYQLSVYSTQGNLVRNIESNDELKALIKEYNFVEKEFIKVPTDEGILLNGYIIKPPGFDPAKKYPLFIYTYGGPNSQSVNNAWEGRFAWYQYLAQQGYIIACIDNRGTDGRGEQFKKCIYRQMGHLETIDQINAAKYLGALPYIDENRIGIFGWSYGGYLTALCLTKGAGVFKMGIAVALVSNWRFYDTIYTERYLGLPEDNPNGYDDNSPIFFADALKGKLLMVHGLADDNVHVQNLFEFSDALVKAHKQFDMHIYPNKNHNISGINTQYHLYKKLTNYILENL